MRRIILVLVCSLGYAHQLQGQTLQDGIDGLFRYGGDGCPERLCLTLPSGVHGMHFNPASRQQTDAILGFLTSAIATSLEQIPFTSANAGSALTGFEGGVPIFEAVSPGPILAERSQTLGRGTYLLGLNFNASSLSTIRGVDMSDLEFVLTHQNVLDSALGNPGYETDIISIETDIQLDLLAFSLAGSVGISDRVDIGVLIPLVSASLEGRGRAAFGEAFGGSPSGLHTFQSTGNFTDTSSSSESAFGIGDIGVRMKANLHQTPGFGIGAAVEARLPTGSEDDFLGSGETTVAGLLIASGRTGDFSPHLNSGLVIRSGDALSNSFLAIGGFDFAISERITLAADARIDLQLQDPDVNPPEATAYHAPSARSIASSNIPLESDDLIDLAIGVKINTGARTRLVANALIPLTDGGVRPSAAFTLGLERTFGGGQ